MLHVYNTIPSCQTESNITASPHGGLLVEVALPARTVKLATVFPVCVPIRPAAHLAAGNVGLWHVGLWHVGLWRVGLWHVGLWHVGLWHVGLWHIRLWGVGLHELAGDHDGALATYAGSETLLGLDLGQVTFFESREPPEPGNLARRVSLAGQRASFPCSEGRGRVAYQGQIGRRRRWARRRE
ncbi:hypothetical protein BC938DRAFT_472848 [Jimgerdemannia flammicorona]|uniref:Uncharacterized protein n=1 Tax=Jimgerdemannia flammicorona TaxID=994334 RepID=A0A433Q583_9FUNG|nr:hypothetical protein BC938DRAFT_472848 [Jimgerdemannia flammicorona]